MEESTLDLQEARITSRRSTRDSTRGFCGDVSVTLACAAQKKSHQSTAYSPIALIKETFTGACMRNEISSHTQMQIEISKDTATSDAQPKTQKCQTDVRRKMSSRKCQEVSRLSQCFVCFCFPQNQSAHFRDSVLHSKHLHGQPVNLTGLFACRV